jgi:hypothetical protein
MVSPFVRQSKQGSEQDLPAFTNRILKPVQRLDDYLLTLIGSLATVAKFCRILVELYPEP